MLESVVMIAAITKDCVTDGLVLGSFSGLASWNKDTCIFVMEFCFVLFFFNLLIFIGKKEILQNEETHRKVFHPLFHSPHGQS